MLEIGNAIKDGKMVTIFKRHTDVRYELFGMVGISQLQQYT